jgi:RNA polymerase sigma-70 factor (ECF subfamily)
MSPERERKKRIEAAYRENGRRLVMRARKSVRNPADAEDAVQDVFLRLLENVDVVDSILNLPAWIFRGVRNRVIDLWRHARAKKRAGETEVSAEAIEEVMGAAGFDPADRYARAELADALSAAIDALPSEQRDVIEAQVFEGSTFEELAARWRVPVNTLMTRKRLGVKKLAAALREWVGD